MAIILISKFYKEEPAKEAIPETTHQQNAALVHYLHQTDSTTTATAQQGVKEEEKLSEVYN
ncbi:hypothetical protein [Pontibacter ruber]|uniref:Uncharacterized protein n=1 Tax=Pontibacter ruber TaxID=1343895 RepID=A0ABW5D1R1_9BACT|nr:hypothetical protein [Pontibacter ruber]